MESRGIVRKAEIALIAITIGLAIVEIAYQIAIWKIKQ
jgi:hypothetical protein